MYERFEYLDGRRRSPWTLGLLAICTAIAATSYAASPPGDSAASSKRIDAIFSEWQRPQSPGCSATAALDGKNVLSQGYGAADLEQGIPNSSETVFNVGSVSKQFTAFAIQLLIQDEKLSLDDDVRKYLPELHDF
jgi:CubicO group peptidase (beta-lactamase class C family)